MIEQKAWFITGARRGPGAGITEDEPSHIHVPRPSPVRRADSGSTGVTWGARVTDSEYRGQARRADGQAA